jgi:hypothetical protein
MARSTFGRRRKRIAVLKAKVAERGAIQLPFIEKAAPGGAAFLFSVKI